MNTPGAADPLLERWARLLFAGLARAGISDVVISPGSRSTPYAWAALHTPELRCHSVWDERSAAFFALGQARVSGRPAALLCTSGSAAANYFPAVVEASLARLPLLVITADRPLELQATSAAQTIDQIKLYGDFARAFFELGTPDASPNALAGLLRVTQQAVLVSRHPEPGPVHLNARARKPLEPRGDPSMDEDVARLAQSGASPVLLPESTPSPAALAALASACTNAQNGLIVCGPESPGDALDLASLHDLGELTGFPLLCEATSQLRFAGAEGSLDGFDFALRSRELRNALLPEVVLRFGAPPTSAGLEWLLASAPEYHVIASHGFPDPGSRARSLTLGSSGGVARGLSALLSARSTGQAFRERWARANRLVWQEVEAVLERGPGLHEGAAVRAAVETLPQPSLLVLGNSLPVREVDQYVRAGARGLVVASQRGANGIDGIVSGAAGAAHVFAGPTLLLLGDVSFLHDLSGLDLLRRAERPLCVVVLDNGGGRIFDQLPFGPHLEREPELGRYWLTPPKAELEHAAALFGLPYARAESVPDLRRSIGQAWERRGASIVHAVVEPESAKQDLAAVVTSLDRRAREVGALP